MEKIDIEKILNLRKNLILEFEKLKDYKNNVNAIMKEVDYAKSLHNTIVALDNILKEHVNFSNKN